MGPIEVHYLNSFAVERIKERLFYEIDGKIAIVCIGTDKCIVDSLGPLVGTMLAKQLENTGIDIYGTLKSPVHALNLYDNLRIINSKNYDKVIAIDACLSNKKNQGIIETRSGPITPGKGVGKILPEIGDVSIVGIVDTSDKDFHYLVQETHLSLIYDMAEIICEGIVQAVAKAELIAACTR